MGHEFFTKAKMSNNKEENQEKLKEAKGKRPTQKVRKDISELQFFASVSRHVSKNP